MTGWTTDDTLKATPEVTPRYRDIQRDNRRRAQLEKEKEEEGRIKKAERAKARQAMVQAEKDRKEVGRHPQPPILMHACLC